MPSGPKHFKNNIERVYVRALRHLDPNGRPCENCKAPMKNHEWVDMDRDGFVINCNLKDEPKYMETLDESERTGN